MESNSKKSERRLELMLAASTPEENLGHCSSRIKDEVEHEHVKMSH